MHTRRKIKMASDRGRRMAKARWAKWRAEHHSQSDDFCQPKMLRCLPADLPAEGEITIRLGDYTTTLRVRRDGPAILHDHKRERPSGLGKRIAGVLKAWIEEEN